jgi:PPK2 family polyphosphate:nucleotide phosphotransferase
VSASVVIESAFSSSARKWMITTDGGEEAVPCAFTPDDNVADAKDRLEASRKSLKKSQQILMAGRQYSVLAIFQALDAAGKDGAIREVFEGLNPAGISVAAFKRPTPEELAHDFLWRTTLKLPRRGEIGVFNRSYYEEVLAVKVHPEYLGAQYAGSPPDLEQLWAGRYRAIREHEHHLAVANTIVLKFWLDVSPARQARRFLDRLEDPSKHWKFSSGDLREAGFRPAYDRAAREMFRETSRPWAPWFCIPADDRWYARFQICEILKQALQHLPLSYPTVEISPDDAAQYAIGLRDTMDSGSEAD